MIGSFMNDNIVGSVSKVPSV